MTDGNESTALTVTPAPGQLRNNSKKMTAIMRGEAGSADYVCHLTPGQVKLLALVAARNRRRGERNGLLIKVLFDGALRVSEALGIRPYDLQQTTEGWLVNIMGKGSKPGQAAITATTAAELQAYAYRQHIAEKAQWGNPASETIWQSKVSPGTTPA